jgi:iron uptake system component EfeO
VNRSRLVIAGGAIVALMIAVGGATYFLARAPGAPPRATAGSIAGAQAETVAVNVTASACDPNELTVQAGRVTFAIHNLSARALEWEILNGVMVVDERENIAPGFTQKLTTKLDPGDYDITCGLLGNRRGKLHVAALVGASAKPSQIDLIGPLAEYRVFVSTEIDGLADDSKRLADAVKSGDLTSARALFPVAHAHYARLAPIVGLFPDLDGAIDSPATAPDRKDADPAYSGFYRLGNGLFAAADGGHLTPLADKLVADVGLLKGRFEDLAINPAPTIAGAVDVIANIAPARIEGQIDGASGADLSDLRANVEGVRKIVDLFGPLIQKVDSPLSQMLAGDFAALESTLAKYRNADGAFQPPANLSADDRTALRDTAKKLAGELALICSALGLS